MSTRFSVTFGLLDDLGEHIVIIVDGDEVELAAFGHIIETESEQELTPSTKDGAIGEIGQEFDRIESGRFDQSQILGVESDPTAVLGFVVENYEIFSSNPIQPIGASQEGSGDGLGIGEEVFEHVGNLLETPPASSDDALDLVAEGLESGGQGLDFVEPFGGVAGIRTGIPLAM